MAGEQRGRRSDDDSDAVAVVRLGPAQPGAQSRATLTLTDTLRSPSTFVVHPETNLRFENDDECPPSSEQVR